MPNLFPYRKVIKTTVYLFAIIVFLFIFANNSLAADKYSMRQRFGVSGPNQGTLPIGWFHTWTGFNAPFPSDPVKRIEWLPMVGAFGSGHPSSTDLNDPKCVEARNAINANRSYFPSGTRFMMGNELGYDDGRSPEVAGVAYVNWRNCLKNIDSTFTLGLGDVSFSRVVPWVNSMSDPDFKLLPACITQEYINAGMTGIPHTFNGSTIIRYAGDIYFQKVINTMRLFGVEPDFITKHSYACNFTSIPDTKALIQKVRAVMNNLGLRSKDLIITEWGPLGETNMSNSINFMTQTADFFITAHDVNIGNPTDNNRLVQQWAWFVTYDPSDTWTALYLYNADGSFTSLGSAYKAKIEATVPPYTCTIQGFKSASDAGLKVTASGVDPDSSTANPYFLKLAGNTTYTVTLEGASSAYTYSTGCASRTDCHSSTDASRVNGNVRTNIYCPVGSYYDLWFHAIPQPTATPVPTSTPKPTSTPVPTATFTPIPTPTPTLGSPGNLKATCSNDGLSVLLTWSDVPNAWGYYLRADNTANPYPGGAGDIYVDDQRSASYQSSITPNVLYNWWVHARYADGSYGQASNSSFTCLTPTNTPTTVPPASSSTPTQVVPTATGIPTPTSPQSPTQTPTPVEIPTVTPTSAAQETPTSVPGFSPTPTDTTNPTATITDIQATLTPTPVPCSVKQINGDYNCDDSVNQSDLTSWQTEFQDSMTSLEYFEYIRRSLYQ